MTEPRAADRPATRTPMYPAAVLDLLDRGRDRPVFEHGDRVVTAAGMSALVRRITAGLRDAGLGPGDGVALMLGVHPEAFAAILAAHAVGARVVGVRPGLTQPQLAHVLDQDLTAVLTDAGPTVPAPPGVRVLDLPALVASADDGRPVTPAGRPGDVARVISTSGSTGDPKGCAQTYAALSAAWAPHPDRWPPAVRELACRLQRYLVFGSLASQVMLEYGVLTLAAGGTMVTAAPPTLAAPTALTDPPTVTGPPALTDPPTVAAVLVRHRASAMVCTVPKLYQLVREQRERPVDLSRLRALMVSGSPLDPGRLREALAVLGPVVFHGYGQTETGMISMLTPAEMLARPATLATVGRPPAAVETEIRDAAGRRLPAGTEGELYVRTPAQANGYRADPAGSAEVFVDGWVRTRDLACLGGDGYLRLLGRLRDVIIVNANLVHAGSIERVLAGHPGVAEAYVVGTPDEQTGEAVHAFVVPTDHAAGPHLEALRALVAGRLGEAATPRTVTLIDRVPIAASGKPDKNALASLLPSRSRAEPRSPRYLLHDC